MTTVPATPEAFFTQYLKARVARLSPVLGKQSSQGSVLFDVEGAFVIPWATAFRDLGLAGFVSMTFFVGLLLVGLYYLLRRGALEWE